MARLDPRDLDSAKSIMDQDGKTIRVEHPLYNSTTKFGKKFKSFFISYRVVVDSRGTYTENSTTTPNIVIDFEPQAPSWSASAERRIINPETGEYGDNALFGAPNTIIKQVAPTMLWANIPKPNWIDLYNAVGGQRDGWSFGPSVIVESIIDSYPFGDVALIPMREAGIKASSNNVRLDIKTGNINSTYFKMGLYTKCGSGSYVWIQDSSIPINGSFDESTGRWKTQLEIPANGLSTLSTNCPPAEHMVTPPLEIGIDDGATNALGWVVFTPYILEPGQNTAEKKLIISTKKELALYTYFYSKTKPNFLRNSANNPFVSTNSSDPDEKRVPLPFAYIKKPHTCNCPSDSVNSGQQVEMDNPCDYYKSPGTPRPMADDVLSKPLYDACGGTPPTSGGGIGAGSGTTYRAEEYKSSQSFMTEFY